MHRPCNQNWRCLRFFFSRTFFLGRCLRCLLHASAQPPTPPDPYGPHYRRRGSRRGASGEGPSRLYRPLLPSCNTHRVPARSPSRVGTREGGQHLVRTTTHTRPKLDTAGCERPESGGEASEVFGRSRGGLQEGAHHTHNADECRSKLGPRRKSRVQSKIWDRGCRGSASGPSGTSRNGGCTGCARQPKLQTGLRPGTRLPLPRLPRRRRRPLGVAFKVGGAPACAATAGG